MNFSEIIRKIDNHGLLNWKTLLLCYLITRIPIVLLLQYGTWNGESMLCYTADCKMHWHNVEWVIQGLNPYKEWMAIGGYSLPTQLRTDWPPFFLLLISSLAFFWNSIWSMRAIFFIFDFLNIVLIYRLAKFKRISVLLYIFAPSILRGLLFPEDELLVTFMLASIYFLEKKKYALSTLMLALSFNHKVFPVLLLPVLLLNMDIFRKLENSIIPKIQNLKRLAICVSVFILVSVILHLFYFPDWIVAYSFRSGDYIEKSNWLIWNFVSTSYFIPALAIVFIILYAFAYLKKMDIMTGYLLGSLVFISMYPKPSFDHLIFLIPLFLIWTKLSKIDSLFWIFFSFCAGVEFLGLPTIGIASSLQRQIIYVLILMGFYLSIIAKNDYSRGRD